MSSTYDPKQMAIDALSGAEPPPHSGLKSFQGEEGVRALATALEVALDGSDEKIKELTDEADSLQNELDAATSKLDKTRDFLENEELTEDAVEKLLKIVEGSDD